MVVATKKSIAELERRHWPKLGPDASHFHRRCYDAVTKPISELSVADLRLLISQDIGLEFVLPIALAIVEKEPLLESEHFRGDLLTAILAASKNFYQEHPEICARVEKLLAIVPAALDTLDHIDFDTTSEAIGEATSDFRRHRLKRTGE